MATTLVVVTTEELTVVLTVELPICKADVLALTLAPTLITVATLTVAGNLAVFRVPDEMLSALEANTVALL